MKTITALFLAFLLPAIAGAAEWPENLDTFDPAKGFKPAQRDLTQIFLQLAGSLEYYGSPVPYLRHVAAEDTRVEKLYAKSQGKHTSIRPEFLSDDALDQFSKNWNHLASKLQLDALGKQVGSSIRASLSVAQETSTPFGLLVEQEQKSVHNRVVGNGEGDQPNAINQAIDKLGQETDSPFHSVRERIDHICAALDKGLSKTDAERVKSFINDTLSNIGLAADSELEAGYVDWAIAATKQPQRYDVAQETKLSPTEKQKFSALLIHDHFTKADFPRMDAFYSSSAYDRLSEAGKDQLSMRFWAGIRGSGTR